MVNKQKKYFHILEPKKTNNWKRNYCSHKDLPEEKKISQSIYICCHSSR